MKNKIAIYVRVSTHHQIDKDSLPLQQKDLINYSEYVLDSKDYEIFEDAGYSAKNTDRPKYQEMMTKIRNGEFSHLLVWKIDRISRNLLDFCDMYEELKKYNCTFVSKNEQFDTSSAMGEAMLKIILVFAELERKLTGERVTSVMLDRASKGLWNGASVPLGYKRSSECKFPVIDENEAEIVKLIYNLYEKNASTSKTAFYLNSEKIKTKRGGKWTSKTVGDILHNPFYIGTYRYNVKSSPNRRWKDKKEWIVVENNHSSFISSEQFEKVNKMLSDNYRGNNAFQRANIHIHIFSGILVCGKCGSAFNAGLDRVRNDGYRPSRYICYSNRLNDNIHSCNNFVSDITLLPFVLNYISNFINLQNKVTQRHSLRDIERILLRGNSFIDVNGIDKNGLKETYIAFVTGLEGEDYKKNTDKKSTPNLELENLNKEKIKYEKALNRLEDLYLFSEESMSQKDFLFKKRDIVQNIERIDEELTSLHKIHSEHKMTTDVTFLNKASHFLIRMELLGKRNIDYRQLLNVVEPSLIKDFIQTVIEKIVIVDKKIYSLTFRNGITHNFLYKDKLDQKIKTHQKFLYKSFEPVVMDYLKENKCVSRKEIESITGMGRTAASSILLEFIEKGLIEKKGNSVATKYFLKEKGPLD